MIGLFGSNTEKQQTAPVDTQRLKQLFMPDLSQGPGSNITHLEEANIQRWVDGLPMANVGETARLVYKLLDDLNRSQLPADERFAILEIVRTPARYVCSCVTKHFIGKSLPLSEKSRKIALLHRALYQQLATGYKLVLKQGLEPKRRLTPPQTLTAAYRITEHLSDVLINCFQLYTPYPEGIWKDLHQIYMFANENGFAGEALGAEAETDEARYSVEDVYKAIQLLSVIPPNSLNQVEVEVVFRRLKEWSRHIQLLHAGRPDLAGLFVIDTGSDSQPIQARYAGNINPSHAFVLQSMPLAGVIEDQIRQYDKNIDNRRVVDISTHLSLDLLKRLATVWGSVVDRKFARSQKDTMALAVLGINAVHHILSTTSNLDMKANAKGTSTQDYLPGFRQRARFTSANVMRPGGREGTDVWKKLFNDSKVLQNIFHKGITELNPEDTSIINVSLSPKPFEMTDVSAGGCCLRYRHSHLDNARIGELISFKEITYEVNSDWTIGVIRRMRSERNSLELGVELLSPHAIPVILRRLEGEAFYMGGLLLPELTIINQRSSLLVPASPYKTGDEIAINVHGQEIPVRLGDKVEATNGYARFIFDVKKDSASDDDATRTTDEFSALWDSL
jgi:hypothetical protein